MAIDAKSRRSYIPKPPDIIQPGDIYFLPNRDLLNEDLLLGTTLGEGSFDHPILLLSVAENGQTARACIMTTFGGLDLQDKHADNDWLRSALYPIYPAPPHPHHGGLGLLQNWLQLPKKTYVKLLEVHEIPRLVMDGSYCHSKSRQKYRLQPQSLADVFQRAEELRLSPQNPRRDRTTRDMVRSPLVPHEADQQHNPNTKTKNPTLNTTTSSTPTHPHNPTITFADNILPNPSSNRSRSYGSILSSQTSPYPLPISPRTSPMSPLHQHARPYRGRLARTGTVLQHPESSGDHAPYLTQPSPRAFPDTRSRMGASRGRARKGRDAVAIVWWVFGLFVLVVVGLVAWAWWKG